MKANNPTLNLSEIKPGDTLINRLDGTQIIQVKDITEKSIIQRNSKNNGDLIVAKDAYLSNNYLIYKNLSSDSNSDEITKENLYINLKISLKFKENDKNKTRTIKYINEDYYLYEEDGSNAEHKADYTSLNKFTIHQDELNQINPELNDLIQQYHQSLNNVKTSFKEVIKYHKKLQFAQNNKIKLKLEKSIIPSYFSELETFCLLSNIPVPLSIEQRNHLKHSDISITTLQGKELPSSGFGFDSDEDQSPRYQELFKVFYFNDNNLKEELYNLVDSMLLK